MDTIVVLESLLRRWLGYADPLLVRLGVPVGVEAELATVVVGIVAIVVVLYILWWIAGLIQAVAVTVFRMPASSPEELRPKRPWLLAFLAWAFALAGRFGGWSAGTSERALSATHSAFAKMVSRFGERKTGTLLTVAAVTAFVLLNAFVLATVLVPDWTAVIMPAFRAVALAVAGIVLLYLALWPMMGAGFLAAKFAPSISAKLSALADRMVEETEPEHRIIGIHAAPGKSILRFAENGLGRAFFGYLLAKDTFLLNLAPGYEFSLIQQVQPDDVEAIIGQIEAAKHKGEAVEGLQIDTKWGQWRIAQFVGTRVEVVVNNHPYIREPEDISLLIAKVITPDQGEEEDEDEVKKKDVFVLVDTIHRGGWLRTKAHYWVGRALEFDELTELTGQLEAYKETAPLGPEPLPIFD